MRGRLTLWAAALAAAFALCLPASADLASFIKKPEPAYRWESRGSRQVPGGTIYDLHLVSQEWQGTAWEHRLQLFRPEKLVYPGMCGLYNTGGGGGDETDLFGMVAAQATGANFAILHHVPKQPLFGGKTEDALVVYTWQRYLETGDDSWPLHFPMAKSVIKAMDALQEFARKQDFAPLREFVVTGASKRGWTAWLVGASRDPRVKAIAPMVIDTLNIPKQIPHQQAAYGKLSEQIDDYTGTGMVEQLNTPAGKRLLALEDPYSHREILTLPKLIILGTNDRYWSQDSLNLYWDDLKGPKWVLYTPNSGHGLEDRPRVLNTLSAFIRSVAARKPWPRMQWRYRTTDGATELLLSSDPAPVSARLFRAASDTRDFRGSKWTSEPMTKTERGFVGRLEDPKTGYVALFGEATFEDDGRTFTLSTQIRIRPEEPNAEK